jgi:hypothetical protein
VHKRSWPNVSDGEWGPDRPSPSLNLSACIISLSRHMGELLLQFFSFESARLIWHRLTLVSQIFTYSLLCWGSLGRCPNRHTTLMWRGARLGPEQLPAAHVPTWHGRCQPAPRIIDHVQLLFLRGMSPSELCLRALLSLFTASCSSLSVAL